MRPDDLLVLPRGRQPRWAKRLVSGIVWLAFGGYEVIGLEKIPSEGPLIVASTHRSYLDPIILSALLPRTLYFMAKKELFSYPILGSLIRAFGTFSVDRDSTRGNTFRTALALLRAGGAVVIFPEGGIVHSFGEGGFKAGVGTLANMSGAPILPVYLAGSNTLLSWHEMLSDSPKLVLRVGEPIPTGELEEGRKGREQATHLTAMALKQLEQEILWEREGG